jgi:hypothetical protein
MHSYIQMEKLLQDHASIIVEVRNGLRNEVRTGSGFPLCGN